MTQFYLNLVLAVLSSCTSSTLGLTILGISPMPSPSHHIWFTQLMMGLAKNGHEIYALGLQTTEFGDDQVTDNRTTSIVFEGVMDSFGENDNASAVQAWAKMSEIEMMWFMFDTSHEFCKMQMATKGAQQVLELVKNKKFDVIVQDLTNGQCFYGFQEAAQGNPPLVGYTPFGSPNWVKDVVGGNNWPAIKPFPLYPHVPPFGLWQKTVNFIYFEIAHIIRQYFYMPKQHEIAEKFIGRKLSKSLDAIEKQINVLLINSYGALESGIFLPPNTIEVGGLHVKEPKPLPQDIKRFLDEAEHGVVVISMGSNVKCSDLGPEKLETILAAISKLKQRVLWKFDVDHLPNKPKNVMIKRWIPQSDVLAHPKIRVLWSHSGLLSTQEAVWRGVPMIGMPLFMDQYANIDLLVKKGVALRLDFESLTIKTISETLERILTDRSFAERMKQLSLEYRDRPLPPLDLAVWHVEYAARHPHGPLASPARDLNRVQLNLLDVYAVLGTAVISIFCITWLLLRAFLNSIFRSKQKMKTDQKLKRN